jgi:formiminotetrahydrofolate cyclodeaminase
VSIEQFLEQVARRGSWLGGGSVAALAAAMAAALLEKLQPHPAADLRRLRLSCAKLIEEDARRFARVIDVSRRNDRRAFAQALRQATEVPCRVFEAAHRTKANARAARRFIRPKLQSDLRCATAVADAAARSAKSLIETNLAWLRDPEYTSKTRSRMRRAARAHAAR